MTTGTETLLLVLGNVLTYTDTGLTNGQIYYYKVLCNNSAGNSPLSNEASATPKTVPTSPNSFVATFGNGKNVLTWAAPTSTGGSAITGYEIMRSLTSGAETNYVALGVVYTYTDNGLTNGQIYYYEIYAINVVGNGQLSQEVNATPSTVPGQVTTFTATYGNQNIDLTWATPASNGAPITNYTLLRSLTTGTETNYLTLGAVNTYLDTGLTNGQAYYYKIYAHKCCRK